MGEQFGFTRDQAGKKVQLGALELDFGHGGRDHEIADLGAVFLEIFIGGNGYVGIYRGTTRDGGHVLMPSTIPDGKRYLDKNISMEERFVWMDQPTVHYNRIEGFRPITRESLEASASGFEKVAHLGDYLGKKPDERREDNSIP